MKSGTSLYVLLCLLVFSGQQCHRNTSGKADAPAALLQRWFNSFEEDHDSVKVYRPEGYDFPLARGRTGFAFLPEGKFEQYDIAPADGLEKTMGTWQIELPDTVLVQLGNAREGRPSSYRFRIISLDKGLLTIQLL